MHIKVKSEESEEKYIRTVSICQNDSWSSNDITKEKEQFKYSMYLKYLESSGIYCKLCLKYVFQINKVFSINNEENKVLKKLEVKINKYKGKEIKTELWNLIF